MRKSARVLGEDYGLTSQEMNYILTKLGYLDGEAGDYSVTGKGAPFAEEQDFHRGTGGYAHYNRYWTTRSWDESIKDELHITNNMKKEAREAVATVRRQHWDEIKKARAEADAAFMAKQNQNNSNYDEAVKSSDGNSGALRTGLIIGGLIALGYGVYKAVPHVVKWWEDTVAPLLSGSIRSASQKEMPCPSCGGTMKLNSMSAIWECNNCDYFISEEALNSGEVFWFCDKCEAFMNIQAGFNTESGHWECSKCGFDNGVTEANIIE